ncbi:MAG TPA: IMP dehydrogenase, partial [Nitrososphaerales archaeon]|nr:IMP dehydrogenase [Nitrososphaerales archaeon]
MEPKDIDLSSNLTKKIKLSLPLVSSPMDTVTEWRMAAELARIGAVGVIHRNMSIETQVEQVKKAKSAKVEAKTADAKGRPLVGASVSPLDTKRCEALDRVADFLVSDVAHFHNSNLLKVTARLLNNLSKDFIAGNIGTRKA